MGILSGSASAENDLDIVLKCKDNAYMFIIYMLSDSKSQHVFATYKHLFKKIYAHLSL